MGNKNKGLNLEHVEIIERGVVMYIKDSVIPGLLPALLPNLKGEKGDKGDKGDTGAQGPKGDKGDTGATGVQGPKGDKGDTGATGVQGPKGDKGDKGETGAQGPKGDKGDPGVVPTKVSELTNDSGYITAEYAYQKFLQEETFGEFVYSITDEINNTYEYTIKQCDKTYVPIEGWILLYAPIWISFDDLDLEDKGIYSGTIHIASGAGDIDLFDILGERLDRNLPFNLSMTIGANTLPVQYNPIYTRYWGGPFVSQFFINGQIWKFEFTSTGNGRVMAVVNKVPAIN